MSETSAADSRTRYRGAALGTVAATAGIVGGSIALFNQLHRRDAEQLQARIDAEELAARDPKWTFNHRPSAATAGAALGTVAALGGIAGGSVALSRKFGWKAASHADSES